MNALRRMAALTAAAAVLLCLGAFSAVAVAATPPLDALNGPALSQALAEPVVQLGLPSDALQAVAPAAAMQVAATAPRMAYPTGDRHVTAVARRASRLEVSVMRQARPPPAASA